ncbi:hypothetical protein BBJ28_00016334 [Nothophytophthora sp. Chile5]|nr:hypothetical protein BBJ28_00016334 [Nothophytophthora sp. Chile5]
MEAALRRADAAAAGDDEDDMAWALELEEELDLAVARRRFSSRLAAILLPLDSSASLVALDVEAELYAAYGQSYSLTKAYGHKARTLLFNLKDSRNADLRNRLLSGELPAHSLVRMSGPDMANPQLVRQRKEWIRKRTHEVMRDGREVDGFESDLFECRNCGSSRTRYRQWRRKAIVDRTRIIVICLRYIRMYVYPFVMVIKDSRSSMAMENDAVSSAPPQQLEEEDYEEYFDAELFVNREAHTALTDGNEIVLELLSANARANADASKVQALPLLWGDHASVAAFERAFPHPVDVLIGADVVCWPMLVKPILQTIKYLLLHSREPLKTRFCCGFVCRAQSTEDLFFREAVAFGFRFERVPAETFLPTPRPAVVTSNLELQLLVFTLDAKAPNWKHPVVFSDAELTDLQTAC